MREVGKYRSGGKLYYLYTSDDGEAWFVYGTDNGGFGHHLLGEADSRSEAFDIMKSDSGDDDVSRG